MEKFDIPQPWCSYAPCKRSKHIVPFLENFSHKRSGSTSGYKGNMNEIKIIMWLMLEGMKRKANGKINGFMLGSNMDNVGNFDDSFCIYV